MGQLMSEVRKGIGQGIAWTIAFFVIVVTIAGLWTAVKTENATFRERIESERAATVACLKANKPGYPLQDRLKDCNIMIRYGLKDW